MISPDRHRCCAVVRRKCLHGYDKGLLFYRTVISLGSLKVAAQVANRMFYIIHNLKQNYTQTSLGSINCCRKRQSHNWVVAVLDGTPNVTSGPRRQHWLLQTI